MGNESFELGGLLPGQYALRLVGLSILIAVLSSYVALTLASRMASTHGRYRVQWVIGGALAMGTGIWAMHFVGMLAFHLPIPVYYHVPTVIFSHLAAVAASGVAFFLTCRPVIRMVDWLGGGIIMGLGISSMHYSGMVAMRLQASTHYDPRLVTLSVLIAIGVSLVGLWVAYRFGQETISDYTWRGLAEAVLMGLAIPSMHYTAMAAASFTANQGVLVDLTHAVDISTLGSTAIVTGTLMVLGLTLLAALVDLRLTRVSEARFQDLADHAPVLIWIADIHGRRTYFNSPWLAYTGRTIKQETDHGWMENVYPDDRQVCMDNLGSALHTRGEFRVEYRLRRADGLYRWVLDVGAPKFSPDGKFEGYVGSCLDITERKLAEETVRASEERFRSVTGSAHDAIISADSSGTIQFWNGGARTIFGYKEEEILGKPLTLLMPERYRDGHIRGLERMRATGEAHVIGKTVELHGLRKDGEEFPLDLSLSAWKTKEGLFYTGIIRDITERKQAEDALRESQHLLRSIIDASAAVIYTKDLDGRYILINRRYESLFHVTRERIAGKTDYDLFPKERADAFRANDLEALVAGMPLESEEVVPQDDGLHTYLSTKAPLYDEAGRAYAVCGISTDITERKRLEEQLRQSQKIEAIGQLAGGIAHDFNNLLTVISGYTQLLLDTKSLTDSQQQSVLQIEQAGERASLLTSQLLAFSRRQDLQPQVLCLNMVVENIEPMLRRLLGEDIEVMTVAAPNLGLVKVDPGQMDQVIMNLAVNARDAMSQGGRFTIETANVELEEAAVRKDDSVQPGRYVMLAVSDTGCGMDAATQARIFEPFFTTKGPSKGTGLGLSTVFGIIKQSDGSIFVDSEPGRGARFIIYLPLVEETVTEAQADLAEAKISVGSETILLVEDEELVRRLNQTVLQARGYTVLEASNGRTAIEVSQTYAGPIHLLATDVVMPGMTGWELAKRLAPLRPAMKVLYMSGYTDVTSTHRNVLDPNIAFLQKPFKPMTLVRKVQKVLGGPITAA